MVQLILTYCTFSVCSKMFSYLPQWYLATHSIFMVSNAEVSEILLPPQYIWIQWNFVCGAQRIEKRTSVIQVFGKKKNVPVTGCLNHTCFACVLELSASAQSIFFIYSPFLFSTAVYIGCVILYTYKPKANLGNCFFVWLKTSRVNTDCGLEPVMMLMCCIH